MGKAGLVLERGDAGAAGRDGEDAVIEVAVHAVFHDLRERGLERRHDLLREEHGRRHEERRHEGMPLRRAEPVGHRRGRASDQRARCDDEGNGKQPDDDVQRRNQRDEPSTGDRQLLQEEEARLDRLSPVGVPTSVHESETSTAALAAQPV